MYLSTGAGLELSPRPLTAAEPEFREDQLAGESPVAHGVKCHVSCDMARYGNAVGHRFVQKKKTICADCEQKSAISIRWRSLS